MPIALSAWAEAIGNAAQMKQRLMELYFAEGGDLTDRVVLEEAAAACGLDEIETRDDLAGDRDIESVVAEDAVNSRRWNPERPFASSSAA